MQVTRRTAGGPGSARPSGRAAGETGLAGKRQRNREYEAAWKQDVVGDGMISSLLYQVSKEIARGDAALGGACAPLGASCGPPCTPRAAGRSAGLSERFTPSRVQAESEEALDRLRSRLRSTFGSLLSAYGALDFNKDGQMTFGELKSGLAKRGLLSSRGDALRELRMAFAGMDVDRHGCLTVKDWVRGTPEDDGARPLQSPEASVAEGAAEMWHGRPAWSHRQPRKSPLAQALFEVHMEEHPLPEPVRRGLPKYFPMPPHYGVLDRSDAFLEKRQQHHATPTAEERELALHCTARPKMAPASARWARDRDAPTRDPPEPRYMRKVAEDLAQQAARESSCCTFRPAILQRSARHFDQIVDDGKEWHDRLYDRTRRPPAYDRMGLMGKKMTKDVEETFFRERVPRISEGSKRRARSAGCRLGVHDRLHKNLPRGRDRHSDDEREGGRAVVAVRYTRSVSFLHRSPGKAGETSDEAATTVVDSPWSAASPGAPTLRLGETLSPTSIPRRGRSNSQASMERLPTAHLQEVQDAAPATTHRLVACADTTDLLSTVAIYARALDGRNAGLAEDYGL